MFQETADEGQGVTELDSQSGGVVVTITGPTSAQHQTSQGQQHNQQAQLPPPMAQSPPSSAGNNNPLTVRDLMLGVIEMQLKRNPNSPSGSSNNPPLNTGPPTISSILKSDHRNDISFVRDYKQLSNLGNNSSPVPSLQSGGSREPILATLSVVSGSSHHGAAITPRPPSTPGQDPSLPKEGLVVMQAQQAHREIEGTLDLSIKKPRQDYNSHPSMHQQSGPHKAQQPHYRTEHPPPPPPPVGSYYHGHPHQMPEQARSTKSPHVYAATQRPPAALTPKLTKVSAPQVTQAHPKLSPKLTGVGAPMKQGSITHGTPVSASRYNEGLLRQMTPPGNVAGQNPSTPSPGKK